jgi:hypothetical protein
VSKSGPYGTFNEVVERISGRRREAPPPDAVGRVIARLLETSAPAFRTVVGREARALVALRRMMPDRLFASGIRRLIGLPRSNDTLAAAFYLRVRERFAGTGPFRLATRPPTSVFASPRPWAGPHRSDFGGSMFRTALRISPLLGQLLVGVVSASAMTAAVVCSSVAPTRTIRRPTSKSSTMPPSGPAAVKRLMQFFEDAMTKDKGDRSGPFVKPLLDTITEPLTKQCVSGDLDDRTRSNLIKFLSDTRDPRAEACFSKVLKEYKVDSTEEDVRGRRARSARSS